MYVMSACMSYVCLCVLCMSVCPLHGRPKYVCESYPRS